ncbi:hypothetical protein Sango_1298800 [Sesamum angolense]|uniref:Uncharacterized protein n=1 Tax=Sesamum angolense TaxID=2727404 RepID=A0AAE1WS39_9LAMI|nr:hypothetical protein Sango_1298800 [Sesamum angolense]
MEKSVKMLIPFDLRCNGCGRRTCKGDRFQGLKEEAGRDACFGVEIYRFQFQCPSCRAAFYIKSDPGRYDYIVESGATLVARKV